MWHSKADIINDLAALNDFGEPGITEPYKILCSIGRGSKAKKNPEPQLKTLLDPRTGEEIELDDDCLSVEDALCRGKGRGSLLNTKNYSLLHKQLRLARPFGSSDEIIESYCKRNCSSEQVEAFPGLYNIQSANVTESSNPSFLRNSAKLKSRIKAVRNSNSVNNALIAGLLRGKEIPLLDLEMEKSKLASEPKHLDKSNQDYDCDFQNGEVKNGIHQVESGSDNSSSWENSEDATSSCTSCKSNNRKKRFDKMKIMGDESCKSFPIDLNEGFNSNLSVSTEEEEGENGIGNILNCATAEKARDKNEIYRKLGERMNNMNMLVDKRKKTCITMKTRKSVDKISNSHTMSDSESFSKEFVYDELNFPRLV